MKYIKLILFIVTTQLLGVSCKKAVQPIPISAVTVVNAVVGSNPIIADFTGVTPVSTYYSTTQKINYSSFFEFSRPSSSSPFLAYQTTDTVNAVYNASTHGADLNLKPQATYSLFLCGQLTPTMQPDALFVQDTLPYHPSTDSTVGVRFINLSPGSNPVNVTLSTSTTTNEFGSLAYKGLTPFKNYPATASVSSYIFQFRDATSNTVLGSFTMSGINNGTGTNVQSNTYRFRNFTIVLKGLPGVTTGVNAQGTFLVNNY